jgi:hypothetical protein
MAAVNSFDFCAWVAFSVFLMIRALGIGLPGAPDTCFASDSDAQQKATYPGLYLGLYRGF